MQKMMNIVQINIKYITENKTDWSMGDLEADTWI